MKTRFAGCQQCRRGIIVDLNANSKWDLSREMKRTRKIMVMEATTNKRKEKEFKKKKLTRGKGLSS